MKLSSNQVTVADTFSKDFKFRDKRKKMQRTVCDSFLPPDTCVKYQHVRYLAVYTRIVC